MSGPDEKRAKRWPVAVAAAALLCGLATGAAQAGRYTIDCPKVKAIDESQKDNWAIVTIPGCICGNDKAMARFKEWLGDVREGLLETEKDFRTNRSEFGRGGIRLARQFSDIGHKGISWYWDEGKKQRIIKEIFEPGDMRFPVPVGKTTKTVKCMDKKAVDAFFKAMARSADSMILF